MVNKVLLPKIRDLFNFLLLQQLITHIEARQQEIEVSQLYMNSLICLYLDNIKSLIRFQAGLSTVNHDFLDPSDASKATDDVGAWINQEPNVPSNS